MRAEFPHLVVFLPGSGHSGKVTGVEWNAHEDIQTFASSSTVSDAKYCHLYRAKHLLFGLMLRSPFFKALPNWQSRVVQQYALMPFLAYTLALTYQVMGFGYTHAVFSMNEVSHWVVHVDRTVGMHWCTPWQPSDVRATMSFCVDI